MLLTTETTEAAETTLTRLGRVLLGLDAVQDVLRLGLVVDAGMVAPAVGGEDEGGDEVQLAVASGTIGIAGTVGLAAPGKVTLAVTVLVLHVLLAPTPQAVEDILLTKLHGYHQTVGHSLGAGIVVLDVRDVAHRVAYLEVDLVGAAENVVEHFLQLGVDIGGLVAHLDEQVTILAGLKGTLRPRGQCPHLHACRKQYDGCQKLLHCQVLVDYLNCHQSRRTSPLALSIQI